MQTPAPPPVGTANNNAATDQPQESLSAGEKLKTYLKKNSFMILFIILLAGVTRSWIGTSFGYSFALNVCKPKIHCPYVMPEKTTLDFEEGEDSERKAKKFISAIVLHEKDLMAQWNTFDLITTAVQKERMRFYFKLGDDEMSTINSQSQDKAFARKIQGARKKFAFEVFMLPIGYS